MTTTLPRPDLRAVQHIVSLSGGLSSAVAGERVVARYGAESVLFWTADTSWEDEDLWRFHTDCLARWGARAVRFHDGRTPLEVAEQRQLIPNQKLAPCSLALKIEPFKRFLETVEKPVTVHLGLDWWETHRMARPKAEYEAIEGVAVDFPLMWCPLETRRHTDVVGEWGIEVPRLYGMGFPHNNCGGRCVRQGVGEWHRLLINFPDRFAEVEQWEQEQRAKGGARAGYVIARDQSGGEVRPVTLAELRERFATAELEQPRLIEDRDGCFCTF